MDTCMKSRLLNRNLGVVSSSSLHITNQQKNAATCSRKLIALTLYMYMQSAGIYHTSHSVH
jgi:hypothetical protein